jgi:hypothetical protein
VVVDLVGFEVLEIFEGCEDLAKSLDDATRLKVTLLYAPPGAYKFFHNLI